VLMLKTVQNHRLTFLHSEPVDPDLDQQKLKMNADPKPGMQCANRYRTKRKEIFFFNAQEFTSVLSVPSSESACDEGRTTLQPPG
jgi:hypothetical protein